jgi:hypothetical protein
MSAAAYTSDLPVADFALCKQWAGSPASCCIPKTRSWSATPKASTRPARRLSLAVGTAIVPAEEHDGKIEAPTPVLDLS